MNDTTLLSMLHLPEIFVDMDGVLADWEKLAREEIGEDWLEEVNKPGWGKFAPLQDLYARLSPMPDAQELWDFLQPYNFSILTAIPKRAHFPLAVGHKREWIYKHFDGLRAVKFGPYAQDKQYHCLPGDIIIDDTELNCEQWKKHRGVAIQHTSTLETITRLKEMDLTGFELRNIL